MLSIHILTAIEGIPGIIINTLRRSDWAAKFAIVDHSSGVNSLVQPGIKPCQEKLLEILKDADVLVACPGLIDGCTLQKLQKLQWMQSTWDGVNKTISTLDKTQQNPNCQLTRYVGNFGELMAEYVLTYILVKEKFVLPVYDRQRTSEWNQDLKHPRLLRDLTIGVLGVGSIGREICKSCSLHGMRTFGLVQSKRDTNENYISQYFQANQLHLLLEECDYICSILPSTEKTIGLLDGEVLSACRKKPVFMNVGRGDVISEQSILNALDQGWISGAILDVFSSEPLPKESPLWLRDNVIITPHIAARTQPELCAGEFIENLRLFVDGKPLNNVVDFDKGY